MHYLSFLRRLTLVQKIIAGLVIGAILGFFFPHWTWIGLLGRLFVGALKAIAPILVFFLVISSLAGKKDSFDRRFGFVLFEYVFSTLLAALTAVSLSFLFPVKIQLADFPSTPPVPGSIREVLEKQLLGIVSNPVEALVNANYVSILFWAIVIGILSKSFASDHTKKVLVDLSDIISKAVAWLISLAPFGILGLVFMSVSTSGLIIFVDYGKLLLLLVGSMLITALVINPLIVFVILRRNPYPLVFKCLRESGLTAFFTRSSAANIPVNMSLCERLGLDKDFYSVSIPLGATVNMDGAAATITIMTIAAVNTTGQEMTLLPALMLSILGTVGACGASGVAGGSLMLIPMACSLFGISNNIAMHVVGVGFIIGVVQDSVETALNSSGDVLFTATAEYAHWKKTGKPLPEVLGKTKTS